MLNKKIRKRLKKLEYTLPIEEQLKKITCIIGHFPTYDELSNLNRNDLNITIHNNGGLSKFEELILYKNDLSYYIIRRIGKYLKIRKSLKYKIIKEYNKMNDNKIIEELKEVINEIGHFPKTDELYNLNNTSLTYGIIRNGGFNKFRKLLGYEVIYNNIEECGSNICQICGKEFESERSSKLTCSKECEKIRKSQWDKDKYITLINYNRKLLGLSELDKLQIHKKWTEENIINKLKEIINEIGYFPSMNDFYELGYSYLYQQIYKLYGNLSKCAKSLGSETKSLSKKSSYINKRGKNTENIIKNILINYCIKNDLPEPIYNEKLAKGNVIEFICNTNKKIGIDVTNTKSLSSYDVITNKYRKKDYYKYLDELWIIVFSNKLTNKDYIELNEDANQFLKEQNENPNKIWIMSIETFLDELDYSIDLHTRNKIDAYKSCTFRTKEKYMEQLKSKVLQLTFDDLSTITYK